MPGPFLSYAKPDVYTRTLTDPAVASLPGNLRIPAVIGVGEESLTWTDYEMIRGSSATADNLIVEEDVSSQVDGTNRIFQVDHYPIVTGDGSGTVTNEPAGVKVYVDGIPVGVDRLDGEAGIIYLARAPEVDAIVTVTYYHNLTDTLVDGEDVSAQLDGTETSFTVSYRPIVDGTGGGIVSMNPNDVSVYINGTEVTVDEINGLTGVITLTSAPAATAVVTVDYYFNTWDNTSDPLPVKNVESVTMVGYAPGRLNYFESTDYTLVDDSIDWGATYKITSNVDDHSESSEYIDETQISATLIDDHIYLEEMTVGSTRYIWQLARTPVTGSGKDRPITSTDSGAVTGPFKIYVGTDPTDALAGGEVVVNIIDSTTKLVTLDVAVPVGQKAYATYWWNRLVDDRYTIRCTTTGASGVGAYSVESEELGYLSKAVVTAVDVKDAAYDGINWLSPLKTTPYYSVAETITITFTSSATYDVASSNPNGSSGSGYVDQTYFDSVTGIMFTIGTPANYDFYTLGPGNPDTISITVTQGNAVTYITGSTANLNIPGLSVVVRNMTDVTVLEEAFLDTFDKAGEEPEVGSVYYVTFVYEKPDSAYEAKIYTSFANVIANYGPLNIRNRVTLAAWLLFTNGAPAIMIRQLKRASGEADAAAATYIAALDDFKLPVEGQKPAIMLPLSVDSTVLAATQKHCEIMSSMRYQGERICFFGFAAGTEVSDAIAFARARKTNRMIGVYPSTVVVGITDALGSEVEYYLDSTYAAVALAGYNVSLAIDVATPMTNKNIVGFKRLGEQIDETTKDMLAAAGLTVLENNAGALNVRHARTTDPTNVFTSEPSITTISDTVQQSGRFALRQFIGQKFLANLTGMIADALASTLRSLVDKQIIVDFKSVSAVVSGTDPDMVIVEAYYQPVFPLNYIQITFNLRSSV